MSNTTVQAGLLTAKFTQSSLRYLRLGPTELLRMIYFALRDEHWGTLPLTVTNVTQQVRGNRFELRYQAQNHRDGRVMLDWQCRIGGEADSTVTFRIEGTFRETFRANRVGFCVLHPLRDTRGQSFTVTRPDGQTVERAFPRYIAPHQPARDIRQLDWSTASGIRCQLRLEGDTFEMEDQRNWTDASYKTYCTPLARPYPVTYQAGDRVSQQVVFKVLSSPTGVAHSAKQPVRLRWQEDVSYPCPTIGSCIPLEESEVDTQNTTLLTNLPLSSLRADLVGGIGNWLQRWSRTADYAKVLQKPLHLVLHYQEGSPRELIHQLVQAASAESVTAVSVVEKNQAVASEALLEETIPLLRQYFPTAKVGVGTPYYFTQLNRHRPNPRPADFMFYANSAQVHAFDNASIVETLKGQAATVASAQQFSLGRPVWVSPVGLHARFSPDTTQVPSSSPLTYAFPPDERQATLFTAGWTLGCLAALATAGAAHVDFFDAEGARGLVRHGEANPTYQVLRQLLELKPERIVTVSSSHPWAVSGLGIRSQQGRFLWLANHCPKPVSVTVDTALGWHLFWQLDESGSVATEPASALKNNSLVLSPRACVALVEFTPTS